MPDKKKPDEFKINTPDEVQPKSPDELVPPKPNEVDTQADPDEVPPLPNDGNDFSPEPKKKPDEEPKL